MAAVDMEGSGRPGSDAGGLFGMKKDDETENPVKDNQGKCKSDRFSARQNGL